MRGSPDREPVARGPRGDAMVHALSLLLAAATTVQETPAGAAPLELERAIELPGVQGRIDHLAVDLARKRLFVAALGNDSVEVLDLEAGRALRSLHGVREPQGILYLADEDRVVVACGGSGDCVVFDGGTLGEVARVGVGGDADNLRLDAARGRVLVAWGGGALGMLDARSWERLGDVPLAGHPEGFCLAADGRRAFVNVPALRAVCELDLERRTVLATWELSEAGSNYPTVLLPAGPSAPARLLVGCRSPARLLVRSPTDGASLQSLVLSGDVDDLCPDARRGRVYAACGEGFVDVFEDGRTGLQPLPRVPTARGARTGLFLPELDRLLVAVPHRGSQRAEVRVLRPSTD